MFDLKPIKLGYTSYETYVDEQTMQQIETLIAGNTYCHTCRQKFSEDRPEVSKNMCLGCFTVRHTQLEYTGRVLPDNQGVPQFLFIDGRGHITLASPDSPTVQESIWATLEHWQFTLPEQADSGKYTVPLSKWRWHSLYSHPRNYAVIATYLPSYESKLMVFLLQKDGSALLLDRRLKRVRDLLAQAKADIIAGKASEEIDEYGSRFDPTDYMIYRRLADMTSEQHDSNAQAVAS